MKPPQQPRDGGTKARRAHPPGPAPSTSSRDSEQDAPWQLVESGRAKGWQQLSSKLATTVEELYLLCEHQSNSGRVGELLQYFSSFAHDFHEVCLCGGGVGWWPAAR